MVPQLCSQCPPPREPQPVVWEAPGWGVKGDLTLYQIAMAIPHSSIPDAISTIADNLP